MLGERGERQRGGGEALPPKLTVHSSRTTMRRELVLEMASELGLGTGFRADFRTGYRAGFGADLGAAFRPGFRPGFKTRFGAGFRAGFQLTLQQALGLGVSCVRICHLYRREFPKLTGVLSAVERAVQSGPLEGTWHICFTDSKT